jgi:flagellar basal body-associated protein FliL
MSDKAEKKPAEKAPAPAAAADKDKGGHGEGEKAKGGGFLTKLPVLFGGAMVIEAVVLFAGFKFLGAAPKSASAVEVPSAKEGGGGETKKDENGKEIPAEAPRTGQVELPLVDFRAPNKQSGRTFLYDVTIVVSCKAEKQDKLKELISGRDALIKDRVRTIIAEMDPEKLGGGSEPGLETLRRQIKFQLDKILEDGLVDEVLVPRCIPFRTDY